jgi:hypothetical protein
MAMKRLSRKVILMAALAAMLCSAAVALDLGEVIKIFGVGWAVKKYSGPIDREINKLLKQRQSEVKGATRVVPIISLGAGGYIGAAQVVGVPDKVKAVQAVVQLEGRIGTGRAKVLVPISTKKPPAGEAERLRVPGVGVSAVADIKI